MINAMRVFRDEAEARAFAKKVNGNCIGGEVYRFTTRGKKVYVGIEWTVEYDDPNWYGYSKT